ncbi:hypothetical protein HY967_03285 [Candidatus Jorgensenbacteria bacterium]|nr:hypothetical protein [Candidatus Jorgensenbacteria bacterium]
MHTKTCSGSIVLFLVVFLAVGLKVGEAAAIYELNGLTAQNQVFSSDGNISISSASNTHTFSIAGVLQPAQGGTGSGSFATSSILFFSNGKISENNSNFFWNDAAIRLGIGTANPQGRLHVNGGNIIVGGIASSTVTGDGSATIIGGALNASSTVTIQGVTDMRSGFTFISATGTALGLSGSLNVSGSGISTFSDGLSVLGNLYTGGSSYVQLGNSNLKLSLYTLGSDHLILLNGDDENIGRGIAARKSLSFYANQGSGLFFPSIELQTSGRIRIRSQSGVPGENSVDLLTRDGVNIATDGWNATLRTNNLTAHRTFDFPDNSGTFVLAGTAVSFSDLKVDDTTSSTVTIGTSIKPGCLAVGDSDGSGVTYLTVNNGALSASAVKPSICK